MHHFIALFEIVIKFVKSEVWVSLMPKTYKKNKTLTQKVLNYEMHRLRNKNDYVSHHMHESQQNLIDRYNDWRLPSVLGALGPIQVIQSVKWLGFDADSHIFSLLYCMLRGCTETSRNAEKRGIGNQDYILLKYSMYKLASETLQQGEQKIIVELMSSAQYTNDISKFLCKYRSLQRIFTSMFHSYMRRKKKLLGSQKNLQTFLQKNKMEHLLEFVNQKFPFIGFKIFATKDNYPEERIGIFVISHKKMYIIECNSCHFVAEAKLMEDVLQTPVRRDITKKIKAGIMYSKIEEESEDSEQFEDIDLSGKRYNESLEKRSSFGRVSKGECSTPKFNPQVSASKIKKMNKQKNTDDSLKQKEIQGFDQLQEVNNRKSLEHVHQNTSSQKNIGQTLVSIQSLLERLKGKKFAKKDQKQEVSAHKDEFIYQSFGFNSNTSIRTSQSKEKSSSLRKIPKRKNQKKIRSISKYRGSSPVSPPSGYFTRYPLSPTYPTIYSSPRPSSNVFHSQVTSPVKGQKVVFTYALKK